MSASKLHYILEEGKEADTESFLAAERARFRGAHKLRGNDEVDCSAAAAGVTVAALNATGAAVLAPTFRCRQPGDGEFEKVAKQISVLGLVVRDVAPTIAGGVVTDKDDVHLKLVSPSWLGYISAKAVWRNEPELRKRYGGAASDAPSVEEEVFAFHAASAAYQNGRKAPDDKGRTFDPVESLDQLDRIDQGGHLRGFVLYEVIHRRYGISLKSLSVPDAQAVTDYLLADVFVLAKGQH
jgi:hypothetical protein